MAMTLAVLNLLLIANTPRREPGLVTYLQNAAAGETDAAGAGGG